MIATNVRRLGVYFMLAFAVVSGSITWWQVVEASQLATRPDNPEVLQARRSLPRGSIFDAQGQLLASSAVIDGLSRRTYLDPAFTHIIGYASLRFGTTGMERAFEDLLVGQTDPNPIRDLVSDVLARQPQPRDLTLTIDRRLQDFAAAQLGADVGAVVAIDPRTGAILAMVSSPTYDATPISGDPEIAQGPMDALRNDPAEPLLPRARQGHYVPGSIMKVLTTAAALDAGAITPGDDLPRSAAAGDRWLRRRWLHHPRARPGRHPARHVGALRGACRCRATSSSPTSAWRSARIGTSTTRAASASAPRWRSGPLNRALGVAPSYLTTPLDVDCAPFASDVELASASFGQGEAAVTPVQMALVAAAIAGGRRHAAPVRRARRPRAFGDRPAERDDGRHLRLGRRDPGGERRGGNGDARRDGRRGERRARPLLRRPGRRHALRHQQRSLGRQDRNGAARR